ncbi:MAG: hypothetical protein JXR07_08460 [Reichenbachiella sp.]
MNAISLVEHQFLVVIIYLHSQVISFKFGRFAVLFLLLAKLFMAISFEYTSKQIPDIQDLYELSDNKLTGDQVVNFIKIVESCRNAEDAKFNLTVS